MMNQNTKDCPICYERYNISHMIDCPNNHVACCIECLSRITNNNCPICRTTLGDSITLTHSIQQGSTTSTITTTTTRTSSRLELIRRREEARREREDRDSVYQEYDRLFEANRPSSTYTPPRNQADQTYDNNIQNIIRNHRNEEQRHRSEAQRERRDRERRDKTYTQQSRRTQLRWSKKIVERSLDRPRADSIRSNDLFNHRSMGQRLRRQRERGEELERAARLASS